MLVFLVMSCFFLCYVFVGKGKCVSIAIKIYLGFCLRNLVLCLYGDFINTVAVK